MKLANALLLVAMLLAPERALADDDEAEPAHHITADCVAPLESFTAELNG